MQKTEEYVISKDAQGMPRILARKITETELESPASIFHSLGEESPRTCHAFNYDETFREFVGEDHAREGSFPTWVSLYKTFTMVTTRIPAILFNMKFVPLIKDGEPTDVMVPAFSNNRNTQTGIAQKVAWIPFEDMQLFVATHFTNRRAWNNSYFFARCTNDARKIWKLPIPNVYADSRICLGEFIPKEHPNCFFSMKKKQELVLRHFYRSEWGEDLIVECHEHETDMFRFDVDFKQLPFSNADKWEDLCQSVGLSVLEHMSSI